MSKTRILLLEDSKSDSDLITRELKNSDLNCEIEVVKTREAFEEALYNFNPEIIVSDYSLPTFNGLHALQIMQQKSRQVPFILVSGTIGEENAVELMKKGVTDYVLKDKLSLLPEKILRALKESEEIKEKRKIEEELRNENEKLKEIAYLQSHKIWVPVAEIIGVYKLFKFDNPSDPLNAEILRRMKESIEALEKQMNEIMEKKAGMESGRKSEE